MSYEQKVLAIFGGLAVAVKLAVLVFAWMQSRQFSDRKMFRYIIWRSLRSTLVIGGFFLWLIFPKSWPGSLGILTMGVIFGLIAIELVARNSLVLIKWLARRGSRSPEIEDR